MLSGLPTRRSVLAASAAAGAVSLLPQRVASTTGEPSVRPFRISIPEEQILDLRRRIAATRWPDRETVNDQSQGIQLGKLKPLVEYWGSGYDWRKAEAKINALPQFMTRIDSLDIHFIHVRSRHPNALPLIMTHGWPGSVFELLKTVSPLTDPTAHGGRVEDAFDLVMPSMPGYGFSEKPTDAGWGPDRIARSLGRTDEASWLHALRRPGRRLGFARLQCDGATGAAGPARHPHQLACGRPARGGRRTRRRRARADRLSEEERATFDVLSASAKKGSRSYAAMMGTRPQTIGYGLTDSPAGLAAWLLGHPGFSDWTYSSGDPEKSPDEVLDEITLYWLTNTATSAARLYWEYGGRSVTSAATEKTAEISLPVAITVFPRETYRAPETWARRAYRNLVYFHEVDKGGHFAAWEQPELLSAELRAAFRSIRQAS